LIENDGKQDLIDCRSSVIGVIFAFMYWISAEKLLIALRKYNVDRMRVRIN
jgi:hypothetical protein